MVDCPTVLGQILDTIGWDAIPARHVEFTGADPVLPTNFRIGSAGAATVAATGLAAADLWELRTGQRQNVAVDVRTAAMALRSERYLRLLGKQPKPSWDAISGFYQAGDGRWIQLHCNFPHHRDGTLEVLGCANQRDAVTAALAGWEAGKLEDALENYPVRSIIEEVVSKVAVPTDYRRTDS